MITIPAFYTAEHPTIALSAELSIGTLASIYNALHGTDKPTATLGKMGKSKVIDRIIAKAEELGFNYAHGQALNHLAVLGSFEDLQAVWTKAAEAATAKAQEAAAPEVKKPEVKKTVKEKKPKKEGPSIREEAEKLLLEVVTKDEDGRPYGRSYEEVLTVLREKFEGAKTTVACLRWYAVHMRDRGERVPNRPRATPAKKD